MVLGAIEKEALDEAFSYLKERLDPEEDIFVAATNFRRLVWGPGEPIRTFLLVTLRKDKSRSLPRQPVYPWFRKHSRDTAEAQRLVKWKAN